MACLEIIADIGQSYGKYTNAQFEEWETNPLLRLGGVGSKTGGPEHAKWLTQSGKPQLRRALGKFLHILPQCAAPISYLLAKIYAAPSTQYAAPIYRPS
jgi:hypothetical protein|eukprot:7381440-Prymnesium_polylepis.2